MAAIAGWFDAAVGIERTIAMIAGDNRPSLKLAARLGYREWRQALYSQTPVLLLERLRGG